MARSIINEKSIKVKSEELQIPFGNLVSAVIIEEMLMVISESKYKEYFWLFNGSSLGLEHYKRKKVLQLEFFYRENETLLNEMIGEIFENDDKAELQWQYQIQKTDNATKVKIVATFGQIQVPICIQLKLLDNKRLEPSKSELHLCMQNNFYITYLQYPFEMIVADYFAEILQKMELINDMSIYQEIFTVIKKETLIGRKVQEQIMQMCEAHKVILNEKLFETILSYRNYSYMKKKWKAYLRNEKKEVPMWTDVIDSFEKFFQPIWNMLVSDTIFIGDWMPELQRYLD